MIDKAYDRLHDPELSKSASWPATPSLFIEYYSIGTTPDPTPPFMIIQITWCGCSFAPAEQFGLQNKYESKTISTLLITQTLNGRHELMICDGGSDVRLNDSAGNIKLEEGVKFGCTLWCR